MNTPNHLLAAVLGAFARSSPVLGAGHGKHTRGAFGAGRNGGERLKAARGAGSINAESDLQQLVRAGREKEAGALYERHMHGVHYRAGKPQLSWGHTWYRQYKQGAA